MQIIGENGLQTIQNIHDYLDKIKELNDCIVILSIKDTAGLYFKDDLQEKLSLLGLNESLVQKFRVGYIAILNNNTLIFEKMTEEADTLKFEGQIEDLNIFVTSSPFGRGNKASIVINGTDYAVNQRGLNIVSFNLKEHILVDSVSFDTHEMELTCHRKEEPLKTKDHYDICVTGFWYGYNYGSLLNGYAEYRLLKDLGKRVLMLQKPGAKEDDPEITTGHNTRFVKKYYNSEDISPALPYDRLEELNEMCDCFCAGSDQIWNYTLSFSENMYLPFVHDNKKKISFATSFGHKTDKTPPEARDRIKSYLKRFHAISVRETFDVDILENSYGLKGHLVFEPVFCLDKSIYEELAAESTFEEPEPYILAYILDPTPEKKKAISYYASAAGMKANIILDGAQPRWERNKKAMDLPNILSYVGVEDFLKFFINASFVITDSFHGTAFSILFNKPFMSIGNYGRGYDRFVDLFERLKIEDRLISDPKNIPLDEKYLTPIDYEETNKIVTEERFNTIEWLKFAIETPINELPNIELPQKSISSLLDKNECMGCGACACACPFDALSLKPDELGYYRSVIDIDKCVDCGICSNICPALHLPENKNSNEPDCFAFIAADEQLLNNSSSGGIFPLLAEKVFQREGSVVGAAWRKDFSVEHIIISKKEELHKLQKSKYLQSYLGKIFLDIKERLDNNIFVLFSGCPCQVAGLKSFLGKEYKNLILVDLLCGNSPSTMFFQKYIADEFPNGIEDYEFRHKVKGWNVDCVTVSVKEKGDESNKVRRGGGEDAYQRVYHDHTMCPPHCEKCKYQSVPRFGDITIGDFWDISQKDSQIDSKEGVSVVLCNNEKGRRFFELISDSSVKLKKKVPLLWIGTNGYAINGNHNYCSPQRNEFYKAIQTMPFQKAANYALKPNHGEYFSVCMKPEIPLRFDSSLTYFRFDSSFWEEHRINGMIFLMVKPGMSNVRRFAIMPLGYLLDSNCEYLFSIRFRIKTTSNIINFHIKDSGSYIYQIIYSHQILKNYRPEEWIEVKAKFRPKSDIYDEFMIGASQLNGENNYICIDYIYINKI